MRISTCSAWLLGAALVLAHPLTAAAQGDQTWQTCIGATTAPGDRVSACSAVIDAHATPHSGAPPLELRWIDGNGTRARLKSRSLRLAATQAALTDLRALLGEDRVRLVRGS